jgi:D-alanyl-D-alanine carboxypeptidase (penicillin-binding protein 5/6)
VSQQDQPGGLEHLAQMVLDAQQGRQTPAPPNPESSAATGRRRRITRWIVLGVVAVLVAAYVTFTLVAPVSAASVTATPPVIVQPDAASIALPTSGESAVSVAGADAYLGSSGILASHAGSTPRPIASISKIITALVVLKAKPLGASGTGPTINFTRADTELYEKYFALNATIAPMPIGTSMSEYDALETMLVPSACNYAEALAIWAYGSDAAFLAAARAWLAAHKLTGTTMLEPTGLDARNTSTPKDLIALGKLAMANPVIAKIVAKPNVDAVPSLSSFLNTNDLLGTDGVDGIKSGTLDSAGSDLLFSANETTGTPVPITITGVILGAASRPAVDSDVKALIASILAGFQSVQLGIKGQVVGRYSTPWGSSANMVLTRSASAYVWSNPEVTSSITSVASGKGRAGQPAGTVTYTVGKKTVTVPVVLKGSITGPSPWWRLTHPFNLLGHSPRPPHPPRRARAAKPPRVE